MSDDDCSYDDDFESDDGRLAEDHAPSSFHTSASSSHLADVAVEPERDRLLWAKQGHHHPPPAPHRAQQPYRRLSSDSSTSATSSRDAVSGNRQRGGNDERGGEEIRHGQGKPQASERSHAAGAARGISNSIPAASLPPFVSKAASRYDTSTGKGYTDSDSDDEGRVVQPTGGAAGPLQVVHPANGRTSPLRTPDTRTNANYSCVTSSRRTSITSATSSSHSIVENSSAVKTSTTLVSQKITVQTQRDCSVSNRSAAKGKVPIHQSKYTSVNVLTSEHSGDVDDRDPASKKKKEASLDSSEEEADSESNVASLLSSNLTAVQPNGSRASPLNGRSGGTAEAFKLRGGVVPLSLSIPQPRSLTVAEKPSPSPAADAASSAQALSQRSRPYPTEGADRNREAAAVMRSRSETPVKSPRRQINASAVETEDVTSFRGASNPKQTRPVSYSSSSSSSSDSDAERKDADRHVTRKPQTRASPVVRDSCANPKKKAMAAHHPRAPPQKSPTRNAVREELPPLEDRRALLARVAQLKEEIGTWDNRIARQRALLNSAAAAAAGDHSAGRLPPLRRLSAPGAQQAGGRGNVGSLAGRRTESSDKNTRNEPMDQANTRALRNSRLFKLRQVNTQLEEKYARLGGNSGEEISSTVQTLVVRADAQLQKAQQRLKEVMAIRRALDNRDKRAAHTIGEVHRRMPTEEEILQRQLNEGIYSRTGLMRTVRELKSKIERTRATVQRMKSQCASLEKEIRQKKLSSVSSKDYEALYQERDAKAKTVARLKTAIIVYTNAVAQEGSNGALPRSHRGSSSHIDSATTSPCRSSISSRRTSRMLDVEDAERQVLAEYDPNKAARLAEQHSALQDRKAELQKSLEELWRRVEQRNDQIKTNKEAVGIRFIPDDRIVPATAVVAASDVLGFSPSGAAQRTGAVQNSSESSDPALVRKGSLRDVLRRPRLASMGPADMSSGQRSPSDAPMPCEGILEVGRSRNGERGGQKKSSTAQQNDVEQKLAHHATPDLKGQRESQPSHRENSSNGPHDASGGIPKQPFSLASASAEPLNNEDVDAMLRKIDEENRRVGQAVFEDGKGNAHPNGSSFLHDVVDATRTSGGGGGGGGTDASATGRNDHGGDGTPPLEAYGATNPPRKATPQLDSEQDPDDKVSESAMEEEEDWEENDEEDADDVLEDSGRSTPLWLR